MTKQVSLRLPTGLLEDIVKHGDRTAYIVQAVKEKLQRDSERELLAGLMTLVDDPENDFSDFAAGQKRVMQQVD